MYARAVQPLDLSNSTLRVLLLPPFILISENLLGFDLFWLLDFMNYLIFRMVIVTAYTYVPFVFIILSL